MEGTDPHLRLTEILASLSLATDLGTGQPMGHGLATCLLAVDLARGMGCDDEEVRAVHQVALLRFVGCTADAAVTAAAVGGDDVGFNAAMAPAFLGGFAESTSAFVGAIGPEEPLLRRFGLVASALADPGAARRSLSAHCEVAAMLGRRLGVGDAVVEALGHAYERWDGKGYPDGLSGAAVPLPVRITMVARDADLFHRRGDEVAARLAARRGKAYDPAVVDAYDNLGLMPGEARWDDVLGAEPRPVAAVADLDAALAVLGDFADLKSPWTRGHSPAVADLAAATAAAIGFGSDRVRRMRWAGLVHDLGRVGVANGVWERPGELSQADWEQVRVHPYHTERILSRCRALADLADVAAAHHERLDGSGYHRRLDADQLPLPARILAAADAFVALTSARPHRPAHRAEEAAAILVSQVTDGGLDGEAVAAVVATARGDDTAPAAPNPGGLTDREVEVLTLIASGRTNKETAQRLAISAKTVSRHVENIYAKIGVSTRAGAAVYAMEHRLLG